MTWKQQSCRISQRCWSITCIKLKIDRNWTGEKNPLHHFPLCFSSTLTAERPPSAAHHFHYGLETIMQISIKLKELMAGAQTHLITVLLMEINDKYGFSSSQHQIWQKPALSSDVWSCCFGIVLRLKDFRGSYQTALTNRNHVLFEICF